MIITAGKYKGTIGYCDDTVGRMAYVYLGAPFVSPTVLIYWEGIEPLTNVSSIEIGPFRRVNPQLCGISKAHLCDIEKDRRIVSPARAWTWGRKLGYSAEQFIELALQSALERDGLHFQVKLISAA